MATDDKPERLLIILQWLAAALRKAASSKGTVLDPRRVLRQELGRDLFSGAPLEEAVEQFNTMLSAIGVIRENKISPNLVTLAQAQNAVRFWVKAQNAQARYDARRERDEAMHWAIETLIPFSSWVIQLSAGPVVRLIIREVPLKLNARRQHNVRFAQVNVPLKLDADGNLVYDATARTESLPSVVLHRHWQAGQLMAAS